MPTSAALALGVAARPLALWFAAQIAAGIVMVHAKFGWFLVGAGQGGQSTARWSSRA